MTANWKISLDRRLIESEVEIWTTGMLWNEAASMKAPPSRPSFERWLVDANASGRLRKVRSGLFLNAAGNKTVSPAAAAGFIKRSAVPSFSWVLEQDWILNNMGDVITCAVPMAPGIQLPNLSPVQTPFGQFQFRALPWGIHELESLPTTDWRDARFAHPRASPEKALCDWLYLANSPRSTMTPPPLDLEIDQLDAARLHRIARAMKIEGVFQDWRSRKSHYDGDPEVIENAPALLKLRR